MQKSLYFGASLLAVVAASIVSASAADMYRGEAGGYKDGPMDVPVATWAGLYFGAHGGGVWGDVKVTSLDTDEKKKETTVTSFDNHASGVLGSGQIGYNFQHGNIVYGVELDLGVMGLEHAKQEPGNSTLVNKISGGLYGDVTGRLGYAFDRTLVYAKGGFAFYNGAIKVTDTDAGSASADSSTGWTIGGGIEHKFAPNWSAKIEYQHFDFGSHNLVLSAADSYKTDLTADVVKAGLNYHVGHGYEPLK